jgi:hypothetical protein
MMVNKYLTLAAGVFIATPSFAAPRDCTPKPDTPEGPAFVRQCACDGYSKTQCRMMYNQTYVKQPNRIGLSPPPYVFDDWYGP